VRPVAEAVFCRPVRRVALYTIFNEGSDNWQSLWTADLLLLAITLCRRGLQARMSRPMQG